MNKLLSTSNLFADIKKQILNDTTNSFILIIILGKAF